MDLATVEISADGSPYNRIAKNLDLSDPQNICWGEDGLAYLDPRTTEWTECIIGLSDYAGSTIQLRFGFNTVSNSRNYYEGFFVDDIIIYGPPCEFEIDGDTNGDCVVDMLDLAAVGENWLAIVGNWLLNCHLTPEDCQ